MSGPAERVREARLLAATGRAAEALDAAEAILDEWPEDVPAELLKAGLLHQRGAGEAAMALFDRAVALGPASVEAWNERARCLHELRRDDEALESARRARELLSTSTDAAQVPAVYLTLLWCLREKRLYREALDAAEECLARTPDAVVAEWAGQIEQELAQAERERC
jgi:tetratricopeptide (TPR) repeat protein